MSFKLNYIYDYMYAINVHFYVNVSINQSSLIQAAWPIWKEDTHVKKTLCYTIHYYYYSTTLHYQ